MKFARRNDWEISNQETNDRTLLFSVRGDEKLLRSFAGTHRVQRVPGNSRGARHTSTATVAVLEPASKPTITVDDGDLRVDRMRGSGRGGQRRNKVETSIRMTHLPSGIVVTRLSGRSQAANIESARADIVTQLVERATERAQAHTSSSRSSQVNSERSGKTFTHCWYRDEVVDHSTGRRWTIRQWRQGRLLGL